MIEEALLVVANVVIANFLSSGSTVRLQTLNGVHLQVAAFSVLRAALASKVHHIQVAAKERRHLQSIEKGRHLGKVCGLEPVVVTRTKGKGELAQREPENQKPETQANQGTLTSACCCCCCGHSKTYVLY